MSSSFGWDYSRQLPNGTVEIEDAFRDGSRRQAREISKWMGPSVPEMRPDAHAGSFKRGPQMAAICIAPPTFWGSRGWPAKHDRTAVGTISHSGDFGGFHGLGGY